MNKTDDKAQSRRGRDLCLVLAGAAGVLLMLAILTGGPAGLVGTSLAAPATGGIPDAGAQREALVRALEGMNNKQEQTNLKLDKLLALLESGKLKVVVTDEKK